MMHQRLKDICFEAISAATLPGYYLRKTLGAPRHAPAQARHLHIGCGGKYLPGFVNIDANPRLRLDMWLDVRNGLPFRDNSVDSIYSTHMMEHFYADELQRVLRECHRVLRPQGGIRIIVPSLASAFKAYTQGRLDWFPSHFPRRFDTLGGRFANFIFCDGQHRTAFDFDHIAELLTGAGFAHVQEFGEGSSELYGDQVPVYDTRDLHDLPHSLYVEAFKEGVDRIHLGEYAKAA